MRALSLENNYQIPFSLNSSAVIAFPEIVSSIALISDLQIIKHCKLLACFTPYILDFSDLFESFVATISLKKKMPIQLVDE